MTVCDRISENGNCIALNRLKIMETKVQTLGRFSIIGGTVLVSLANMIMSSDDDSLDAAARIDLYVNI